MLSGLRKWNKRARIFLWILALVGVAAAMPLGAVRMEMESAPKYIDYVFDYRDIIEIAELQPRPKVFIAEQLAKMKEAGITSMAVYESSLKELQQSGRLTYYNSKEAALLQSKFEPVGQNFTYILFTGKQEEEMVGPIVRAAFDRIDAKYSDWAFDGRKGMVVEMSVADALLKTMEPDPMSLQAIHDAGLGILPRFSDRVLPFDIDATDKLLGKLKQYNVNHILFDGDKVKGVSDFSPENNTLQEFAELLNKHDLGIIAIENLKKPQQGMNKLAYYTNYNVVRLYSLSSEDGMKMTPEGIADRFLLAAKDRNISMFFIHGIIQGDASKGGLVNSLDKLSTAMGGEDEVIAQLADAGFKPGVPQAYHYEQPSWSKALRGVVALGAIALIALLVGAFIPGVYIPVFILGVIGTAGLYVLNSSIMEQGLALGAAISAPTLALIWVMNRIHSRTLGDRRIVGGEDWSVGRSQTSQAAHEAENIVESSSRLKWVFPGLSMGRRIGIALNWFIVATLISLTAVPIVFGLLHNITYSLVLEQFRGVGLLHLAPIALTAVYVLFYNGQATFGTIRKLLSQPITIMRVILVAIVGIIGFYYLSRTGNGGQTTSIELIIRNMLETTFGVRPRFKEFLFAHPLLVLGLFLSLRYRAAWLLVIVGSIGQLSMVDTFAHLHTPLYISAIRVLLGLGGGIIFGCILILVWQLVEGAVHKWVPAIKRKFVG